MTPGALLTGDPLDRSHPLARGLAGFWLALPNKQGATLFDLCGRSPGTLTGGPTWTAGRDGFGAVRFAGGDDRVEAAQIAGFTDADANLSCVAVFRWDGGGSGERNVWSQGVSGNEGLHLRINAVGNWGWLAYNGGVQGVDGTAGGPTANRWYCAVGTFSPTAGYRLDVHDLDAGTVQTGTSGSTTRVPVSGVPQTISGWSTGVRGWQGDIAAVLLYDRVLPAGSSGLWADQARRGFPDLLRRSRRRTAAFTGASPPPPPPPSYFLPAVAGLGW